MADRYTTALDLASDLKAWRARTESAVEPAIVPAAGPSSTTEGPTSERWLLDVVPKGLRSFDTSDADFFLELLPGPRDRDGLPECLRFWKTRIEETDPAQTFSVGLIYGPSGCGKSSLLKAGIQPRLAAHVTPLYLECTPGNTELQLSSGVRRRLPELATAADLAETLVRWREESEVAPGRKLLIILDQFEQWLHAHGGEEDGALVRALRQCDGGRAECILIVRDDFWMSAIRFMRCLEVVPLEGRNIAAVDLFDLRHARKVLAAFGRALEALPRNTEERSRAQNQFLDQAVAELGQAGKVLCLQLSLFAEMVKSKPWTPATLRDVGGAQGIGVKFLEESFAAPSAPAAHRWHLEAVRGTLKALLPETGMNIKGHVRSRSELLTASGYADRPHDFDDLIRILDDEIRLLTLIDPRSHDGGGNTSSIFAGQRASLSAHARRSCSDGPPVAAEQAEGHPARTGGDPAGRGAR